MLRMRKYMYTGDRFLEEIGEFWTFLSTFHMLWRKQCQKCEIWRSRQSRKLLTCSMCFSCVSECRAVSPCRYKCPTNLPAGSWEQLIPSCCITPTQLGYFEAAKRDMRRFFNTRHPTVCPLWIGQIICIFFFFSLPSSLSASSFVGSSVRTSPARVRGCPLK